MGHELKGRRHFKRHAVRPSLQAWAEYMRLKEKGLGVSAAAAHARFQRLADHEQREAGFLKEELEARRGRGEPSIDTDEKFEIYMCRGCEFCGAM